MTTISSTKSTDYHLDYETFSPAEIKKVGAAKYASHPEAEILMAAIASDTEGPYLWIPDKFCGGLIQSDPRALPLIQKAFADKDAVIWAHNALFEIFVTQYCGEEYGFAPDLRQWRCTAALARRAGMPDKLEKCAEVLKLEQKKDSRGAALIRKFSKPQTAKKRAGQRIMPQDEPDAFMEFGEYCLQDVRTEKAIHAKLKPLELTGALLETFLWDLEINTRGIPVNVTTLRNAKKVLDEAFADLSGEFYQETELFPTQRERVKAYLKDRFDLAMPNLKAKTVTDTLKALKRQGKFDAYRILKLYSTVQYAAARKVYTMLDCACDDGYVRGAHLFYGAGTGRWAGRLIQPQNFKKPTVKEAHLAYELLEVGMGREEIELVFPNSLEAIASCIRNFIHLPGHEILDADYNAVEARIVCWLADQEDVLDMYRAGRDLYKYMAGMIYNRDEEAIVNPSDERELGKRTILGCGFQMAAEKFRKTCEEQYGIIISQELAEKAVLAYRTLCWRVAELWYECDDAARNAILRPGVVFKAGSKLSFQVRNLNGIPYLCMKLPSGRSIVYPWPKIEDVTKDGRTRSNITFFGNIKGSLWGRISTYGGKLLENATQGTAMDVMSHGGRNASKRGFDPRLLVHDQGLSIRKPGQTIEAYCAALTSLPPWAAGLPIKAEGKIVKYYKK